MTRKKVVLIAVVCFVAGAACVAGAKLILHGFGDPVPEGTPTASPDGEGWIDLLDAEHAGAWKNVTDDKDLFEIKDGMLHIYGRMIPPLRYVGYTAEPFGDFDLHIEFKLARRTNSGVFLRAQLNDPVHRGFEVQVLDDFGRAPTKNGCGAIYDVVTPMFNLSRPAGEWNSFDIAVEGPHVVVVMNGWKVIDTDFSKMTKPLGKFKVPYSEMQPLGHLTLQDHGGEAWYRNIRVHKR